MNPSRFDGVINAYEHFRDTGEFLSEPAPAACSKADPRLIGHPVRYFGGRIYLIEEVNHYGDYTVLRFDDERKVWQRTSMQPDPAHPLRHWELVASWQHKRLRRALMNAKRLHGFGAWIKGAKAYRRAHAYRRVLCQFFARIQAAGRHYAVHGRNVLPLNRVLNVSSSDNDSPKGQ